MSEIHDILDALGVEVLNERGDEAQALCPMHEKITGRADRNPSWWINTESGFSTCFSCGYSANLQMLVADIRDLRTKIGTPDFDAANAWLSNYRDNLEVAARKLSQADDWYGAPRPTAVPMTEARLALFVDPPEWALEARKLTAEACRAYGVLWDPEAEAWITPLRHPESHKLMGWQMKGQKSRLFRNLPPGMVKTRTLFGVDQFTGGTVVVVESPLDCVRILSAGVEGAVAVCGSEVSREQILILRSASRIILAMDNDKAGDKALRKFYDASLAQGFDFLQFSYGDSGAKDPGDMTKKQIRRGIRDAVHSVYGLPALLEA